LYIAALQIWLVFWPGFFLGILHTLLPCEDKAIFFFYTFGTSRDSKESFKILTAYGFGLLLSNLIIGTIASFGGMIFENLNEDVTNGFGAISVIISGVIMLFQNKSKRLIPHHQQGNEISETFKQRNGQFQKKTAFILGMVAGIPPCVFELAIYTQAFTFSASSGVINGIFVVFFFGIGTWIGLFPLAAFGMVGPVARNYLKKRNDENKEQIDEETLKQVNNNNGSVSKVQLISAFFLIGLGVILLILAISGINIFTWPEVPPV
jgi:sulfite exporter TauE/SafE